MNDIKNVRQQKKITQKELARMSQISLRSLIYYENTKRKPNAEIAIRIAKALNSTCEELWGEEEKSPHRGTDKEEDK